jgi:metal-responsive CopG/Arc/MetJ family transcriptional regulator
MSKLSTKTINISLPAKLLDEVDEAAKDEYASRSDYIRDSILRKLRSGERWETVTDLTKVEKGGIDIDDLLERV